MGAVQSLPQVVHSCPGAGGCCAPAESKWPVFLAPPVGAAARRDRQLPQGGVWWCEPVTEAQQLPARAARARRSYEVVWKFPPAAPIGAATEWLELPLGRRGGDSAAAAVSVRIEIQAPARPVSPSIFHFTEGDGPPEGQVLVCATLVTTDGLAVAGIVQRVRLRLPNPDLLVNDSPVSHVCETLRPSGASTSCSVSWPADLSALPACRHGAIVASLEITGTRWCRQNAAGPRRRRRRSRARGAEAAQGCAAAPPAAAAAAAADSDREAEVDLPPLCEMFEADTDEWLASVAQMLGCDDPAAGGEPAPVPPPPLGAELGDVRLRVSLSPGASPPRPASSSEAAAPTAPDELLYQSQADGWSAAAAASSPDDGLSPNAPHCPAQPPDVPDSGAAEGRPALVPPAASAAALRLLSDDSASAEHCSGGELCRVSALPRSVWHKVMGYADTVSVLACRRVSLLMRSIATDDDVWRRFYWRLARENAGISCLPYSIDDEATHEAAQLMCSLPGDLCRRCVAEHRRRKRQREAAKRQRAKARRLARLRRNLDRRAPEVFFPCATLVALCMVAAVLLELLRVTGVMGSHRDIVRLLCDVSTVSALVFFFYTVAMAYACTMQDFLPMGMRMTLGWGLVGSCFAMAHKAVRDVPYSWSETCTPLTWGLIACWLLLCLGVMHVRKGGNGLGSRQVRDLVGFWISLNLIPLAFVVTLYVSAQWLAHGSFECLFVFLPVLIEVFGFLPWPPLGLIFWLIYRLVNRRNQRSWTLWWRRELVPYFCCYLLYCLVCLLVFLTFYGVCYVPALGFALLLFNGVNLTIALCVGWTAAIHHGVYRT
eukprot:TRINITY_DN7528_c5_g1_i1.p1 TRINITY_DN7528_c5_g1~~TRINITY_DN7528_c5_g1_i1.p1  ORF type:complete len:850 (+),score=176.76 TRINITY_DN7528_c5_g1_i1:68-2551(+)